MIQDELNSSHLSQTFHERKRKRPKCYVSSDDEVAETTETSVVNHPRHQDSLVANSVVDQEEHERDDQRFNYAIAKPTKSKAKVAGHGPPARKKSRRVLASDPETDNEYLDTIVDAVDSGYEFEDENENDYLPPDPKPTTKGQQGKGKASANISAKGGAKRRAKVDNVFEVSTTSKKRSKLTPKPDDVSVDVVGDGASTPNVSLAGDRSIHTISKHDSSPHAPASQQLLPKKQKLPTIKKVKLPHLNTSTSSSTVVIDTPLLPLGGKPAQDGVRKTLNGTIDIDLSNKSIYEEIFSKTVRVTVEFLFVSCSCFYRVKEMGGHHGLGATDGLRRKKDGKS